jgi:hypothetical protein
LEILRTVCEGSIWTTDLKHIRRRQELAHSYVDYADTEAFFRDIRKPEKEADVEDAEGSDSSQDEEEAEDTNIEAPEQGSAPARGDGSIPSARSSAPEADIFTATAPPTSGSASTPAP